VKSQPSPIEKRARRNTAKVNYAQSDEEDDDEDMELDVDSGEEFGDFDDDEEEFDDEEEYDDY